MSALKATIGLPFPMAATTPVFATGCLHIMATQQTFVTGTPIDSNCTVLYSLSPVLDFHLVQGFSYIFACLKLLVHELRLGMKRPSCLH